MRFFHLVCGFGLGLLAFARDAVAEPWEVIVPTLERGSAEHVLVLPDGDILVAGSAALATSAQTGGWVARFGPDGMIVWSHEFVKLSRSEVRDMRVVGDRIIVAGTHYANNPRLANWAGFAAALTLNGDVEWETAIDQPDAGVWMTELRVLASGNYLVMGSRTPRESMSTRAAQYALVSPAGKLLWSYDSEPTGEHYDDMPRPKSGLMSKGGKRVQMESPGPVIEQNDGSLHLYVRRREVFDTVGVVGRCEVVSQSDELIEGAVCKRLGEGADRPFQPFEATTFSPGYVTANKTEVLKRGEDGEVEWIWTFEDDFRTGLTDAVLTPDGGLIGVGYRLLKEGARAHRYDAVMFRLDAGGHEVWSHVFASETRDIFAGIAALGEDEYVVVGQTGLDARTPWWDPWILRIGGDGVVKSGVPVEP